MKTRKKALKAVLHPTGKDLAWAAGFLEGEGCFYLDKTGQKYSYLTIFANQVNPEPVERLLKLFGGNLYLDSNRYKYGLNNKPIWIWKCSGVRARGIAYTLFSLMSNKRKHQILKALSNLSIT